MNEKNQGGFSLLEVLISFCIVSVMIVIISRMEISTMGKARQAYRDCIARQSGFTLLEMILSLALGTLCLMMCVTMLSRVNAMEQQTFQWVEQLSDLYYIDAQWHSSVAAVSFQGCWGKGQVQIGKNDYGNTLTFSGVSPMISHVMVVGVGQITIAGSKPHMNAGDIILLTNCQKVEWVNVLKSTYSAVSNTQEITLAASAIQAVQVGWLVGQYQQNLFYINESHLGKRLALFVRNTQGRSSELVSGISELAASINNNTLSLLFNLENQRISRVFTVDG